MKTFITILALVILLALTAAFAVYIWVDLGAVEISLFGLIAMGFAIFLSLVIGVGLMALVYHSAKSGHDQKVDDFVKKRDKK